MKFFLKIHCKSNDSDLKTDLKSFITLWKVIVFSRGKESCEFTLFFVWLWEITYVIPLYTLTRYLTLL